MATLRRTHDYVIVDTPVAEAVGHELFDDFVLRDSSVLLVVLDPRGPSATTSSGSTSSATR